MKRNARRRVPWTALVPLLTVLAGACAGLATGRGADGIDHPTDPGRLVLRVEQGGGFVPVEYALRDVPIFSLYGDGLIVTTGPQIAIYPGPALPNLVATRISDAGIQAILRAARDAGLLGRDRHYDNPGIADAATTTFAVVAEGRRHVVSAYALGVDEPPGLIPEDEREARRKLSEFQARLSDLRRWLPEGSVGEERPFEFDELRIFVRQGAQAPQDEGLEQPEMKWPLQDGLAGFGLEVLDLEFRCGSMEGASLETLLPLVQNANELTPWRDGGELYSLIFRPLLPDESGCEGIPSPY
ncbi:MAG: hypothetical protein ACRDGU_08615 [Actinomycetota bacterium]